MSGRKALSPPSAPTQAILSSAELYSAPWRERLPSGELGEEYGPPSPTAQARRITAFKDWAYRKELASRAKAILPVATMADIAVYIASHEVSNREREVFRYIAQGHGVRWIARKLSIRRQTVQVYIKRLAEKVKGQEGA